MASEGDLTASGFLYEGNLKEWLLRMDSMMRIHGFTFVESRVLGDIMRHQLDRKRPLLQLETPEAQAVIRCQISPELIERIPEDKLSNASDFFGALRGVATPFQFAKLPPELRHQVLDIALQGLPLEKRTYVLLYRTRRYCPRFKIPQIGVAGVNHEFLARLMEYYLRKTEFILEPDYIYIRHQRLDCLCQNTASLSAPQRT